MHLPGRAGSRMRAALRSMCVIGFTCAISACSQWSGSPEAPSGVAVTSPAPVVNDVVPSVGSTGGNAIIKIVGRGFSPGMVVAVGGIKVTGRFDSRGPTYETFYTETPPHAVGSVDVVVTSPDGQSYRLANGYTYAPPASFDPNGVWSGYSLNGTDTLVEFAIRENRLIKASCTYDTATAFTLSDFPTVQSGEFSMTAADGATISGRIVSASEVVGTISLPPCTTTPLEWRATRR